MNLILISVVFFVGYVILKKLEIINNKLDEIIHKLHISVINDDLPFSEINLGDDENE